MHETIAGLAAGALRPIVAEALARVERVAALMATLVGCGLLAVAGVIGLIAAGAVALAPSLGTATAVALGSAVLLILAGVAGLLVRRALVGGSERTKTVAEPATSPAPAAATASPGAAGAAAGSKPLVDPTLAAAVCATTAIILGPSGMVRAVRGTVEAIRLAASLLAGVELVKSLDNLVHALRTQGPGEGAPQAGVTPAGSPQV